MNDASLVRGKMYARALNQKTMKRLKKLLLGFIGSVEPLTVGNPNPIRSPKKFPTLEQMKEWTDDELRRLIDVNKAFCIRFQISRSDMMELASSLGKIRKQ